MERRSFLLFGLASCVSRGGGSSGGDDGASIAVPAPLGPPAVAPVVDDSALQRRARVRRESLGPGFEVVVEPPFVVIGDEGRDQVVARAEGTVRWAVERLRAEYFREDPTDLIEIWLFGTAEAYERAAVERFGGPATTPYGYYTHRHHALVMNIATGGGTLVHEIVHPFMAANFPACPSWFDEGLASLYEQSADHDGRIWGLTNWRLPDLQRAIEAGEVPSSKVLTATGDRPFYDADPGTNYAQARYLCLWLQEHGLLREYHAAFTATVEEDPTGHRTLARIVGVQDMDGWDRAWQRWVMGLRYG